MISVEVRYKLVGRAEWSRFSVAPAEYFSGDSNRPPADWDVDDVPRHAHVRELLPIGETDRLERATTAVRNSRTGDSFECAYQFWGGPHDFVCWVREHRQGALRQELIFSGGVPFEENGSQVVRVSLDGAGPRLTMNCFLWGPGGDDHSLNMLAPDEPDDGLRNEAAKAAHLGPSVRRRGPS